MRRISLVRRLLRRLIRVCRLLLSELFFFTFGVWGLGLGEEKGGRGGGGRGEEMGWDGMNGVC